MKDLKKGLKEFSLFLKKATQKGELTGYALIGGVAVSARARPRATKDIDFLVSGDGAFLTSGLPDLISKMGYKCKMFNGDMLDPLNGVIRVFDNDGSEFVDLIPVFWNWHMEAIKHAEEVEIFDGIKIPVARVEDLIVLKLKAGGPQDMLDVHELIKAAKFGRGPDKGRLLALAKQARVDKKLARILEKEVR